VTVSVPKLDDLLLSASRRALHLELRDVYAGSPAFVAWLQGIEHDRANADARWRELIGPLATLGGDVRRARIVSEPVTDYIKFEYEVTPLANLAAGERVRWLPRREASTLALPGNDFWLVDDHVLFNIFSGMGEWIGADLVSDHDVVQFCANAFEEVWKRGTDHADYQIK
jgi:hypothetical protein